MNDPDSVITNSDNQERNPVDLSQDTYRARNAARDAARARRLSYLNNQKTSSPDKEDSLIQETQLTEMTQKILEFTKRSMSYSQVGGLVNININSGRRVSYMTFIKLFDIVVLSKVAKAILIIPRKAMKKHT